MRRQSSGLGRGRGERSWKGEFFPIFITKLTTGDLRKKSSFSFFLEWAASRIKILQFYFTLQNESKLKAIFEEGFFDQKAIERCCVGRGELPGRC